MENNIEQTFTLILSCCQFFVCLFFWQVESFLCVHTQDICDGDKHQMCLWQLRQSDFKTYPELSFLLFGSSLSHFCFFVHPWIHGAWNNCSLSPNLKHSQHEQMCSHPVWVTGSHQVPVSIYVACVLCIPALNIPLFCNYKLPAGFTTFGLVFMSAGRKPSEEIWSVFYWGHSHLNFYCLVFLFFISSRFPFQTSLSMFWWNFFLRFFFFFF